MNKKLAILFFALVGSVAATPAPHGGPVLKPILQQQPNTPYPQQPPTIVSAVVEDCGLADGHTHGPCATLKIQANVNDWCTGCNWFKVPLIWADQSGSVFYSGEVAADGTGDTGLIMAWVGSAPKGGGGGPIIPSATSCIRIALGDSKMGQQSDYSRPYCLKKPAVAKYVTVNVAGGGRLVPSEVAPTPKPTNSVGKAGPHLGRAFGLPPSGPSTPYPQPAPKIVGGVVQDCGLADGHTHGPCATLKIQANISDWCADCNWFKIALTWADQSGVFYSGDVGADGSGNSGIVIAWIGNAPKGGGGGPIIPSTSSCVRIALGGGGVGQQSDFSNPYCLTRPARLRAVNAMFSNGRLIITGGAPAH